MNKFLKIALGLTLAGLGFTACKDTEDDLLPEHIPFTVTDITNVMIPDVSITPGMTLSIPGVGFNQEDTQITLSASDGRTTAPENISLDEDMTAITFTLPENCELGEYAVNLTRTNGDVVTLGTMTVVDFIKLENVSAKETYSLNSWISIQGVGFYEGDVVLITDFQETYAQETEVSDITEDGGSIRFESPLDVSGKVTAQLKRGTVTTDLPEFVIGELLPELTDIVIPEISIAPGMTLTVFAKGIATTDNNIILKNDSGETGMTDVTLTEESIEFTIPETVAEGKYTLGINRTDNTMFPLGDVELVTDIEIANAKPELEKTPVNEPFKILGEGFYYGDRFKFVSQENSIDEIVQSELDETPDGDIISATLTPPANFIGEAKILVVRGIAETEIATVNIVDEIGNVVIPSFSIVRGQTVTIAATNVKENDVFTMIPDNGGNIVTPDKVSSDTDGYTMTLADDIQSGTYTLHSTLSDQDLGKITVSDAIEFDDLTMSDDVFIKGSEHDVIFTTSTASSAKTFAPRDEIQVIDASSNTVFSDVIEASESNTSITVTIPGNVSGEVSVNLVRGSVDMVIGTANLIDEVKVGDYHKGGIVVWLNPENPAHGICMNLFHGNATQRNVGVLHNRRTAFGHENLDHGTDPEEYQDIQMGAICTQMIFDAEEKAGYDPTEPVIDAAEWDGPGYSAARLCADLKTTDKYTGKEYDDWYLPTIKLLNLVYPLRNELNVRFDEEGGESFAGTGYVYQYGAEAGQSGYDAADGSANYVSSNQSLVEPDNGLNQARYQSFTPEGASGWYNKQDPYYYVRAARSF